jgi:hypothetical protein
MQLSHSDEMQWVGWPALEPGPTMSVGRALSPRVRS